MRTHQKRKRSSGPLGFVKRRRLIRKRRFQRRNRPGFSTISRSLNANTAFKPRARKLKKSVWRRMLWRDTLQQAHYRSIFARTAALVTPNDIINLNWTPLECLVSSAPEFWKTAGGTQDPSFGVVPQWANANGVGPPVGFDPIGLVIRGGRLWCTLACTDGDSLTVRMQLVFAKQQSRDTTDAAVSNTLQAYINALTAAGSRPKSWDITTQPDYEEYFYKPVIDKTVQLQQGQTITTYYKLKPTKIDVAVFQRAGGWFPYWIVYAAQDMNVVGAGATTALTFGHNLSFAVTDLPQ